MITYLCRRLACAAMRRGARFAMRAWCSVRRNPSLAAVILVGCLTRAVLLPITHGQDFVVWDRASAATLHGVNVYANHPSYPGGPYAYFPLFLFIELPLRWLAAHSGVSFTVLGKLPIVAGDLLSAAMIAVRLRQQGHRDATVAIGTALFFLNPLVLYNGAFYGRFDSVCLGLLLLALWRKPQERPASWRSSLRYALAVAAKTFPIVILPGLIRSRSLTARRAAAALVAVLGALSLPYLLTSPHAYITDVVLYDARKLPSGLSWQRAVLPALSSGQARWLSYLLLALFALALFLVSAQNVDTYCLAAIILFLLSSKVVLEQYCCGQCRG
jgi:uncharacterized membrane protein